MSKMLPFSEKYLPGNLLSFIGAGTNLVSHSIAWHFFNCADKPETVQKKIHEEIDRAVGQDRQPDWEDHVNMPYTMAAIHEMHRWRPMTTLAVPRGYDLCSVVSLLLA